MLVNKQNEMIKNNEKAIKKGSRNDGLPAEYTIHTQRLPFSLLSFFFLQILIEQGHHGNP
jgi:hypothetical protein